MKRLLHVSLVLLTVAALTLLAARAQAQPASDGREIVERARQRGQAITARAFGVLSSNLMTALARGGVSNALQFCSVEALPLTASVADTNQFTLRRVSHKARNPQNKADAAELAVLEAFRAAMAEGKTPAPLARANASGGATFFAPVVLNNPLCLNCHGQPGRDIKPEHLALLRQLYPHDQATGFRLGDLRGLWRIDFKPEALPDAASLPR